MKIPKKIILASGPKHNKYTEISIDYLVDNYDYGYYSNFMERWARDAVSNWVGTEEENQKEFLSEYLKIAHQDLIVDDL